MPDMNIYEPAERWFEAHRSHFAAMLGQCVVINAEDFTYAVGDSHEKACEGYRLKHGPTPADGYHVLSVTIPERL